MFSTAFPRSVASELLKTQKDILNWQIEQSKLVEKQMATMFDTTRASMRLGRDLADGVAHTMIDAMLPEGEDKASA